MQGAAAGILRAWVIGEGGAKALVAPASRSASPRPARQGTRTSFSLAALVRHGIEPMGREQDNCLNERACVILLAF